MPNKIINIKVGIEINASPNLVWSLITDWNRHSKWIPFTKVNIEKTNKNNHEVGVKFEGITKLAFLKLVDPMVVTFSQPPSIEVEDEITIEGGRLYGFVNGELTIEKLGESIKGKAGFTVSPLIKDGKLISKLTWWESVYHDSKLISIFNPALELIGGIMFQIVLKNMKKDLESISKP